MTNEGLSISDQPLDLIRAKIGEIPYVRAEGLATIEDYERIKKIATKIHDILKPIKDSFRHQFMQLNECQNILREIELLREQANEYSNKNQKKSLNYQANQLESKLEEQVQVFIDACLNTNIPQWIIDAVELYIDTFMKGRINIRIYPFDYFPNFQVIANLKS